MIDRNASRGLVAFIRAFTDLQEKHLEGIHQTMRETVDGVMRDINAISESTRKKKEEANAVLEKTYTNPDEEVLQAMNEVQEEVDRVISDANETSEEARGVRRVRADQKGQEAQEISSEGDDLRNKLRRNSGLFSKHMQSLATLDNEVQDLLFSMMGQLSRDDVISQRIEHVMMSLQALQTSLTYLLTDYETRCSQVEIAKFSKELREYAMRIYTMQEERKAHYAVFPDDKVPKKIA